MAANWTIAEMAANAAIFPMVDMALVAMEPDFDARVEASASSSAFSIAPSVDRIKSRVA